nr:latent-transforming growth factor beta-binding protein 4 isoform X2 [Paramormyrops kingsleyae]
MPLLSFLFWFHCCMSLTHSASSQTVSKEGERIKMFLTPTICKVRCSAGRCTNYCEHGNVTTLYSNEPVGQPPSETGFRIFLCPMLCQNGGVCIQKDRCQCPQNFTGKFCHIPVASSTNDIEKSQLNPSVLSDQQFMSQSEYLLPLQSQEHHQTNAESSMVKVRVQHPPEASIKIHQVLKVGTGETGRAQQDTVTRTTRVLEARNSLPGEKGEALLPPVQAQEFLGDSADTESSVFKYCFREFRNGQCSSRLPGLRTPKTCCEGTGIAWGINECILCPSHGNGTDGNKQCPKGYERINDTQCVDINECLQPSRCQNGNCINTRGSYSCICRQGYLLDASHRICVSEKVISEDKGQCYRLLSSGVCSLPILRNITKQICCCSRVGKAWGRNCEKCPYFGSDAFKETCPAGPGYHYSPFAHQPNQKVTEHHDTGRTILTPQRHAQPPSDRSLTPQRVPEPPSNPAIPGSQTRTQSSATDLFTTQKRTDRLSNASTTTQSTRVLTSSTQRQSIHQANRQEISSVRPVQPAAVTPRPAQPRPGFQGCDSNPQLCGPGRCVDLPGERYTCICNSGYQLNLQRTRCFDIDECRRTPSPCDNGYCENAPGSFRCVCFTGYELRGNTCIDINECKNDLQCPGQECVNTKGSFRCVPCRPGFELKNQQCQDIDECRRTPSPCDNGYCQNVPGSFRCRCFTGYELRGNTCLDINECKNDLQCPGQECVNTKGSFRCVPCRPGFELKNQQCQDVDECLQNPSPCVNSQCENSPGSYQCVCSSGYKLEGNSCIDVDECEDPSQCAGEECVNLKGSYRCIPCRRGYIIQNGRCTDVDECQSLQGCGPEGICVNTAGSYHCDCQPGYRAAGPGHQCKDINECFEGEYCFPHGECMNTEGSYLCVCSEGFKSSMNLSSCIDVDECARPEACQDGSCVNTQGSFQCQCDVGFMTNPEQTTCLDKDECADSGGAICWPKRCENTIGSYYCVTICEPGYTVSVSGECMDENECETIQGVCGTARCENMEGSFLCECPGENEEFDLRLRRCFSRPQSGRLSIPNGSSYSSTFSFWNPDPQVPIDSAPVPPPASLPGELRECYYNIQDQSTCRVLTRNSTYQECCCTVGEGWGLHCQYSPCPTSGSVAYQALCPSGRGYVTSESGVYSYRDVDECKLFDPEVCKRGLCVNNIPGYACYCPTGNYYHSILLECIDNDECEGEVACFGGTCVNTMGSFYCSCEPPLVLDYTQRNCVNMTGFTTDENLAICWGQVTEELICQNPLLGRQVTFSECCCLYGYAWQLDCALCPSQDSDDFEVLCNALRPPGMHRPNGPGTDRDLSRGEEYDMLYESYPERPAPGSDFTSPGYNPYASLRGRTSGYRGRPLGPYRPQESPYDRQAYASRGPERRAYLQMSDVVPEPVYEARPRPRSRGGARSLPPRRQSAGYRDLEDEDGNVDETRPVESWMRFLPEEARSYPSYPSQPSGRALPERRYESYQSFSTDECGIVNGCQNGRCIRISEGYTCDCYDGYYLDIASMTCIDINECEEPDDPATLCVNGQCVNTDGSYRCICERGYIMYHEPNLCIPSRSRP